MQNTHIPVVSSPKPESEQLGSPTSMVGAHIWCNIVIRNTFHKLTTDEAAESRCEELEYHVEKGGGGV